MRDDIIQNEMIKTITNRLVENFNPVRIMLFGSYSTGFANKHSDVDLLVIVENGTDVNRTRLDMQACLRNIKIDKDLKIVTEDDMQKRGNNGADFMYLAMRTGIILHDRKHSSISEARRLLQHAKIDRNLLKRKTLPRTRLMALGAYNVILTSIKAAHAANNIQMQSNNIDALYEKLVQKWNCKKEYDDASGLTKFVFGKNRKNAQLSENEVAMWRDTACSVFEQVNSKLIKQGVVNE